MGVVLLLDSFQCHCSFSLMPSASTLCVPNGTHQFIKDFASTKIKKTKKKHRVQNHLPHGGGWFFFSLHSVCSVVWYPADQYYYGCARTCEHAFTGRSSLRRVGPSEQRKVLAVAAGAWRVVTGNKMSWCFVRKTREGTKEKKKKFHRSVSQRKSPGVRVVFGL